MDTQINEYLSNLFFKIDDYELSTPEKKQITREKTSFIVGKLNRKKFRHKVSPDTLTSITSKVNACIKDDKPIYLNVPFGGYKHFWNPSHPDPDWAEVFHFRHMVDYVLPILAAHSPGVIIEYVSEDLILPRMNNYRDEALESYSSAFQELIVWFNKLTPTNLEFRFSRVSDRCDKRAIISKVESLLPERKAAFEKLADDQKAVELNRSLRSVNWHGKQDLSELSEDEKYQRIIESRLIELAFYDVEGEPEFMGEYYWSDNHICICFSFGLSPDNDNFGDLTIATSHGSIVDFWIGRGVIKHHADKFLPTIVSRQQYEKLKSSISEVVIKPELVAGKNYRTIDIIPS